MKATPYQCATCKFVCTSIHGAYYDCSVNCDLRPEHVSVSMYMNITDCHIIKYVNRRQHREELHQLALDKLAEIDIGCNKWVEWE